MAAEPSTITPTEAVLALKDLRATRDTLNHRAAGMSLMMWALVLTSATGSVLLLDRVPHEDMSGAGWGIFLAANVLAVAAWAAVGALFQNTIWSTFGIASPRVPSWRAPLLAFGAAFALVASNLLLQGVSRSIQGIDGTAPMADLHHNLGFAFAFGIGGGLIIAITLLMASRGFRRAPGVAAGIGMMLFGHLATFLWFPSLGIAGALIATASIPLALLGLGYSLWKQG